MRFQASEATTSLLNIGSMKVENPNNSQTTTATLRKFMLHYSTVIVGILGMGSRAVFLDLKSFDRIRSHDFLPRKYLVFLRVGKTNDSQTTTATTRRCAVLRSTTVLFSNPRNGEAVVRP